MVLATTRRTSATFLTLVGLSAVIMGLPTVRGGFVGGDDHRLALDHVLVNRPSLDHAIQLFAITHRDLYQPLPLLSFSAEFLICDWLGWTRGGPERFAWFFHLNNVWLHAVNAMLVFMTIRMMQRRMERSGRITSAAEVPPESRLHPARAPLEGQNADRVAAVAAVIFAVHPLNAEVVAWINGRMMLLSTAFALLSLLTLHAWLERLRMIPERAVVKRRLAYGWPLLIVVLVLGCAVSKIRIGLPVLMLIVVWAGGDRVLSRRFLPCWLACVAVTAVFAVINVQATAAADLFSGGAEHLRGPRAVRVFSALAFYFSRFVYPVGLASYYPTPPIVSWSDGDTWIALFIVIPTFFLLALAIGTSRLWRLGVLWFFATMIAVLPIMPARNVLAADRYMYLPMIGLLWPTAATLSWIGHRIQTASSIRVRRIFVPLIVIVFMFVMVAQSWNVAWYYETPLKKTLRVAMLFPDVPRVWERLGWSHYELGDYAQAAELAQRELHHEAPDVQSGAYQLMGMAAFQMGHYDEALKWLHQALEVAPDNALGTYRLATVYDDLGRLAEALPYYERAVEAAPLSNPTLHRLASVYRRLGYRDQARLLYEREITNNAFEVGAYVALAEMAVEDNDVQILQTSSDQLTRLLQHIPDAISARITLGIVEVQLGRPRRAMEEYLRVLSGDPNHTTALLNLAELYRSTGDLTRAAPLFERAVALEVNLEQALAISDYYVSLDQWEGAQSVWTALLARDPSAVEPRLYLAWVQALRGDREPARRLLNELGAADNDRPIVLALRAYVSLGDGAYEHMVEDVRRLVSLGPQAAAARRRLLAALERFDHASPGNPWTFCAAARILIAQNQGEAARASIMLCQERCQDERCRKEVADIRSAIESPSVP